MFNRESLVHVVDGPGLKRLCAELRSGPAVALDLETTQLSPFGPDARVVCAAVTWECSHSGKLTTAVIGLSHPDSGLHRQWRKALRQLALQLRTNPLIAHNASFDLTWIKVHTGVNLYSQLMCDTALTSHILDENFSAGLKPRAVRDLGAKPWLDFSWKDLEADERANPDGRKLAEREEYYRMTEYCAEDTYWTYRLYERHSAELDLWGTDYALQDEAQHDPDARNAVRLGEYYNLVGQRTVCALAAIEENGFALDSAWCTQRLEANQQLIVASQDWLTKRTLDAQEQIEMGAVRRTEELEIALAYISSAECSWSAGSKWFLCWAQLMCAVGELHVASRTPKGRPQWSKEVLDKQAREGSDVALKLREMRVAMTESAYIQSWLNEAQADGRIRASYNYATSPRETSDAPVTGRLSCSKPNLQQVARSAKAAFCAAPGNVLLAADYSQVEVRVGAFQARCEPLIEAYRQGLDVHTLMASSTSGIPYDQITPELRQGGKAGVFGFEFGMSAEGFVLYAERTYGVAFELAEAERVRQVFFETWDGMSQWHAKMRKLARQQGYVVSPLGRIRHLPDAFSQDQYLQGRAMRQAINSPVQGMASDIMMLAIWRIDQTDWIKPVAVVHDCVIVEVPAERAEEASAIVREAMEQGVLEDMALLGCKFDVPLVADISISASWGK